jgi:hypothetical protein
MPGALRDYYGYQVLIGFLRVLARSAVHENILHFGDWNFYRGSPSNLTSVNDAPRSSP